MTGTTWLNSQSPAAVYAWTSKDLASCFASDRDRCRDHHDGRSRGHDHSRGDGGGDDDATRDAAHPRRQLSTQD